MTEAEANLVAAEMGSHRWWRVTNLNPPLLDDPEWEVRLQSRYNEHSFLRLRNVLDRHTIELLNVWGREDAPLHERSSHDGRREARDEDRESGQIAQ